MERGRKSAAIAGIAHPAVRQDGSDDTVMQKHIDPQAASTATPSAPQQPQPQPPRWVSVAIPALIATAFALLLVFMLLSPILLPALNLPTGGDAEQADSLRAAITHPFPPRGTAEAPAAQAIYTDFTRRSSTLLVYGVTDPAAQQQIVQQVREAWQRLETSKPVEIRFIEREVWVQDGSTGYRRGKERLLHRELIR